MGIIGQEDIIRHFNPDISDEELAEKLNQMNATKQLENEAQAPRTPLERLINA